MRLILAQNQCVFLDTTTVTSEQLKGWINQWQKPYLSSVNELIATSAFSSLAIIWAEVRSFFIVLLYGFSLSAVFQWEVIMPYLIS